jgi:hypothetical protein
LRPAGPREKYSIACPFPFAVLVKRRTNITIAMKVAPSALRISLALREMAGVRETVMAAATYIFRGGADAMAVSRYG